jgi:hypothetical protein
MTWLLFWHWLQRALYTIIFSSYYDELDSDQQMYGTAVCWREALYALTIFAIIFVNPAFLTVDVSATVRDADTFSCGGDFDEGYSFLALYVLPHEKVAAPAAVRGCPETVCNEWCSFFFFIILVFGTMLLDLYGVMGLYSMLMGPVRYSGRN